MSKKNKGLLGIKEGMTQVFNEKDQVIPVTVVRAGPCQVIQKKTVEKEGYNALQIGFMPKNERRVNKPLQGHFEKSGTQPYHHIKEIRIENIDEYEVGQELSVDIFSEGEEVDVMGISKGKGFTGAVKRHGFSTGPKTHGSRYFRRPGSLAAMGVGRVFKGRKLPGHKGAERVTIQNLKIIKIDSENNCLVVRGSIPGPRKGLVLISEAVNAAKAAAR